MKIKEEYFKTLVEEICKKYSLPIIEIKKSKYLKCGARYIPNKLIEYTEYNSVFLMLWDVLHELGHHRYQHKDFNVNNEYEAEKFAYEYIKDNLSEYICVYIEMLSTLSEDIDITEVHKQALKKLVREVASEKKV